jgi:hypothetical protein
MPRYTTQRVRPAFVALVAAIAFAPPARAADVTPYLPDGTMLVLSVNVKQFLQTPLVHTGSGFKPAFRDAIGAFHGFGFDPTTDVERMTLAVGEQLRSSSNLLLLHGRFDAEKILARMKEKAQERKGFIEVIDESGAAIFQCRLPPPGPSPKIELPSRFVMTVLDNATIALSLDRSALTEALAKRGGRRKTELKPRVVELVGRIDPTETLTVVFVPPAVLINGSPLDGLTTVTGGVAVVDGIKTDLRIDAKDAASAKKLADNAREALTKVRELLPALAVTQFGLESKDQDVIREMIDSFKVNLRQDSVIITSTIPKELVEKMGPKDR